MRASFVIVSVYLFALGSLSGCKPAPKSEVGTDGEQLKVFTYARASAHKSLDPMRQFDGASGDLIRNLYDSLFEYSYLKRPYQLRPNLLKAMPEKSADGLSYTFELRGDVKFIDNECFPNGKGRVITSDDVLYSLKRFADANINTSSFHVLLKDKIVGLDAFRTATQKAGKAVDYKALPLAGFERIDERRFKINFIQPNPLALMPFAASALSIIPHEAVTKYGDAFERNPVGSGPFKMAKYDRRGVMILKRNPDYHGVYPTEGEADDKTKGLLSDAGKKVPLIDEVRLPLIEEAQPRVLKFLKGEIDWIGLDKDNFVKMAYRDENGFHLKPDYAKKYRSYFAHSIATEYYAINMKDPLLGKNKALRQAIALALDVPGYVEKMRNGRGAVLSSMVPLGIAGNEKDINFTGYQTNLEAAKQKLKEAGYPDGQGLPPLTVEFRGSSTLTRQDYEFHRAQLAKVGIKLEGSFQTFSAFLRKVEAGNFQIAASGWAADYPDAENFYQLFYGPNKAPGPNESSFSNPEYDAAYQKSKFMPNSPERFALFKQMAGLIREEVPGIVIYNPIVFGLYQPWIGNMKRNMMEDLPLKYISVDPSVKKGN